MPENATLPPETPAQDTSVPVESTSVDTQPVAAPETPDQQTEPIASGTDQPGAPSTTEQPVDQNQAPTSPTPEKPSVDWQDRYRNLQSYHDRRFQAAEATRTKLQQELQQLRQQQEQAALKPWSKQSPNNSSFRGLLERSKAIYRQTQAVERLPPEQRQAAMEAVMAGVTPEEHKDLAQYREAMQSFQNDFFSDPESTLAPFIQRNVQQAMQQMQERMRGEQQVDHDFSQPHLKPILENPEYSKYLDERLKRNVPYEDAMEMLKLRAAVDLMYKKLHGADRQATHAQEQQRLVKQRAGTAIQADPAAAPADAYSLAKKEAAKLGIEPGTAAFNKLIDRYTAAG